jgi:hypothetical protein
MCGKVKNNSWRVDKIKLFYATKIRLIILYALLLYVENISANNI